MYCAQDEQMSMLAKKKVTCSPQLCEHHTILCHGAVMSKQLDFQETLCTLNVTARCLLVTLVASCLLQPLGNCFPT
jgi:hypothetical protein